MQVLLGTEGLLVVLQSMMCHNVGAYKPLAVIRTGAYISQWADFRKPVHARMDLQFRTGSWSIMSNRA
jgi:hypothetical protein